MSFAVRLIAVLVSVFIFSPFCAATPIALANTVRRSSASVHVQRPGRLQNVPVARLGVPYMFQLDFHTFTLIDSQSGAPLKVLPIVALDPDSNLPHWMNFDPDSYLFSGTPTAVPETPFRIRVLATAPESGDQNDTTFDLYVSDNSPPSIVNSLGHQYDMDLMGLVNAARLVTQPGVWIHPGSVFTIQIEPFCNISSANSSLYYSAYHTTNTSLDALPSWLHFDNTTLSLSGTGPLESSSITASFRCSNIYGAGGPEQTLLVAVVEHAVELNGSPPSFTLAPGIPFKYTFQWLSEQLWVDGKLANVENLRYFNSSRFSPSMNASSGDIDLSFALDNYPWLYFDKTNATIYGTPPPQTLPHESPSVSLNISYQGQGIRTAIPVDNLDASPWSTSRDSGVITPPNRQISHNFALDLIDSVRHDPRWDMFIKINDPINETSWLNFDTMTHFLNGTVPVDSPSREVGVLVTSNAWGFNTTIPYSITINNPDWVAYAPAHTVWTSTSVTIIITLVIVVVLLIMSIFILCGIWRGWLISPIVLYRRRHRSSRTLIDSNSEIGAGCCKPASTEDIQVHVEHKVETTLSNLSAPLADDILTFGQVEHDTNETALFPLPLQLSSPTSGTAGRTTVSTHSNSTSCSALSSGLFSSDASSIPQPSPGVTTIISGHATSERSSSKKFALFKKRIAFRTGDTKKKAIRNVQKSSTILPIPQSQAKPFTPLWKGHVYQTPAILKAEEDAWKARRLERKTRLKREYFEKKQGEAESNFADTRFRFQPHSDDDAPKPGAPRRFGIFEQLAKMEDLDRRGPANMRGCHVPRSRLVEVGENRFFDDTMLDRSEVGSSEFSSLASWETLSESSIPDMVLCYGQLGRRKMQPGDASRTPRLPISPWGVAPSAGPVYREEGSLPEPDDDTVTDENLLDRLARSLGSEQSLDQHGIESVANSYGEDGIWESTHTSAVVISSAKWKGKGVARGEHGSPTTSQHSPTFKRLARQRFQASIDGTIAGSPLSKMAINRAPAYTSPTSQSLASGSTNLSPSSSMTSLIFHVNEQGVHYYIVPAGSRFCFTARINKVISEEEDAKPSFGRVKAALYSAQMVDSEQSTMPLWLHFNAPGLEFWGSAPNTEARLQHAINIVHRESGEVVGQFLVIVARLDDVANIQTTMGCSTVAADTLGAVAPIPPPTRLASAISLACGPRMPRMPLNSSRSVMTSQSGTDLSSLGSMTSVVFHLARDGLHFFVIPANTDFCFEVPGLQNSTAVVKSTFGRAVTSPYSIQMDETSEVTSIPPWLHFTAQSMEFWGEAPNVDERVRIGMKVVQKETGEVLTRLLIVVARLDDVGSLQAELDYKQDGDRDGLSVVEEVSSVDSDDDRVIKADHGKSPVGPKTPERSRNNISASSSRVARGYCSTSRSQPTSRYGSPASRRSPGTPLSKASRGRMRTPMSARMVGYEDYDSVMFEGNSQYSGSLFGPELGTLTGGAISSGALEAMSRAASRAGSLRLVPGEKTVMVVPTVMDGVEYYIIRGSIEFQFTIQMYRGRSYDVEFGVNEKNKDGWKTPRWIGVDIDEKSNLLEFSGSTRGVEVYMEETLRVLEKESGDVVKCVRVVVVPDAMVSAS